MGLEPMTMHDHVKFDLNAITTRPRTPLKLEASNQKIDQYALGFSLIKWIYGLFWP